MYQAMSPLSAPPLQHSLRHTPLLLLSDLINLSILTQFSRPAPLGCTQPRVTSLFKFRAPGLALWYQDISNLDHIIPRSVVIMSDRLLSH